VLGSASMEDVDLSADPAEDPGFVSTIDGRVNANYAVVGGINWGCLIALSLCAHGKRKYRCTVCKKEKKDKTLDMIIEAADLETERENGGNREVEGQSRGVDTSVFDDAMLLLEVGRDLDD
jgi:hypothetical protein